jgi:hypothetical protein
MAGANEKSSNSESVVVCLTRVSHIQLKQVRKCDGQCCIESPRFPNKDHSDCIYRDASKPERGCKLQADPSLLPEGNCPVLPKMSAREAFEMTCLRWPQETAEAKLGETENCCWQWVTE